MINVLPQMHIVNPEMDFSLNGGCTNKIRCNKTSVRAILLLVVQHLQPLHHGLDS